MPAYAFLMAPMPLRKGMNFFSSLRPNLSIGLLAGTVNTSPIFTVLINFSIFSSSSGDISSISFLVLSRSRQKVTVFPSAVYEKNLSLEHILISSPSIPISFQRAYISLSSALLFVSQSMQLSIYIPSRFQPVSSPPPMGFFS